MECPVRARVESSRNPAGANAAPPAGNGGPMRAADLDLKELLDVDPERAIVRFAGQRVLILDTIAMGILRKELLESLGQTAARALLTRFGYAYGWRAAETLGTELPWDNEEEKCAGVRRVVSM